MAWIRNLKTFRGHDLPAMRPRAGENRKLSGKVVHVSPDGRYGYIQAKDHRRPNDDVHFRMDVVRDSGGLSLAFGDRVEFWIQPQGEGWRPTAAAVHLVSLAPDTDRRKKALAQMEQWRQQICMQSPSAQDAKFQARTGRAVWQAVLELLEPTMRNETWQTEVPGPSAVPPSQAGAEAASPSTCRHAFCAERHYAEKVYLQNRALRHDSVEQSMSVDEVKFTHAEISDQFGDGRPLETLLADLRRGKILPSDDRMQLEACLLKDKYRSLNNRRLRVLKIFHVEQKRMDPTCAVQVRVQLRPLCKSTAQFIQNLCKSDDRSKQTSPVHPDAQQAKQTLLDIENASVQNRKNAVVTKWALSSLGKEQEVLVSALTYIGAPTRQRNGLMNKVTRDKRRRMDDVMTNMIDLKTERAINGIGGEVEVVEFEEKLYLLDKELCKALRDKQDRHREDIKIKIRIIPLCPWTAKMVLANSSLNDGEDVQSKGSESEWPLCRLVYLLLDLANSLAQEPNFSSTFDLISVSPLLGQGALISALKEEEHGSRMWEAAALLLVNLFKLAPTGSKAAMPVCAYMQDVTDDRRDLEESNCQSRRWLNLLSFSTRAIVGRPSDAYEACWDMLSLVPTVHEIQRDADQCSRRRHKTELPTVRERGCYNSEQHYLDTYFRLLREECLAAIRTTLYHVSHGNMEAEEIRRDGNVFDASLMGFNVSRGQGGVLDSRIKVVFRVRPKGTWERWRSKMDRSFKFGNLVACICDNDVTQPIWMLVACRDVDERTVALGLYSAGEHDTARLAQMWDAGQMMLIASTTYFRSLEPVLRRLQDAQQVGFAFKEELVHCQTTPRRPSNVHAADPVDWKLFFSGPRPDVKDDSKFLVVGPELSGQPVHFRGTTVESPDREAVFKVILTKHGGEYGFRLHNLAGQIFIQLPGTKQGRIVGVKEDVEVQIGTDIVAFTHRDPDRELRFAVVEASGSLHEMRTELTRLCKDAEDRGESTSATTCDSSQLQAVQHALRCRVSLIQGPPGTGKTFIGYKLLRMLEGKSRILVLTYKNDALDGFLDLCRKDLGEHQIARIGRNGNLRSLVNRQRPKRGSGARCSVDSAQRKVQKAMERFRERGQHTVDTFLRRMSFEQLSDFLWWRWNTAESLLQKMKGAAPEGSDPLCLLLDEEGSENTSQEGGFTKEDRGSLRQCIEEELTDWSPSWEEFRLAAGEWLSQTRREPQYQDAGGSEAAEDPEQQQACVGTLEEWLSLLESLDTRGRLMKSVKLDSGIVEAGWVLRDGYSREAEPPALPLSVSFDKEDEADLDVQREIELERLASVGEARTNQWDHRMNLVAPEPNWQEFYLTRLRREELEEHLGSRQRRMFNSDLQGLSHRDRAELIVEQILEQALQCFRELDVACKELEAACAKDEANEIELSRRALEHHRVIGMTVVGASIHFSLLAQLKPEVVLVEEAAEVLEPQILAVLGPWVKQLIMIGDTNQLPPQIETFKLKREHHFDVSMMERLILNRLESVQLCKQSRMLPDLRSLLEPIYPDLCDNVKMTTDLKAPECVASPVFFWDCRDLEASSGRSLVNETECDRAVHLAAFFISEGFAPSEITLLAPYAGQVSLLKKQLARKLPELVHAQPKQSKDLPVVSSVDRYQGAENSIIIVSLVRSNPNRKLGFLGWDDGKRRMCVAQSRAKRGLYFIGNAGCLRNAPHWGKLLELLTKAKAIGPGFPQRCPRHPDIRKDAEDAAGLWIKGCIHTAHCLIDDSDDSLCMYARPCDKSHGGGPEDEGRPLKSRRCT